MTDGTTTHDMEAGLIGSVLLRPETLDAIAESVSVFDTDFDDPELGTIWRVVTDQHEAGKPVDLPLLIKPLKKSDSRTNWAALLAECLASIPNAAHGPYYASYVKQHSQRRQLAHIGRETVLLAASDDEPERTANDAIGKLEGIASPPAASIARPADWLRNAMDLMELRTSGRDTAMRTGFAQLDMLLAGGLRAGEFCVIAGRPGTGKTALAGAIAGAMSKERPVLFVSLEMSQLELADRMLSAEAGVKLHQMKTGTLSQHDRDKLVEAADRLAGRGLSIIDTEYNLPRITALARQWRRREGMPGVLIIDYLQLLETDRQKGESRQEEVARIARRLKQLAKVLEGPVIALAQLNRQADGERPRLSHLRESGAIEQDANQVVMLSEQSENDGEKLIRACLEKNRNGATGEFPVLFRKEYVSMEEPAPERLQEFDDYNQQGSGEYYEDF
jgi:replicative DNA helicase